MLQEENKILVAHRRLFERDDVRFFVGRVVLDTLRFKAGDGLLSLTDGKGFTMNMAEHAHRGRV